jgi:hypothetical protein
MEACIILSKNTNIRGCIQKFPDWPPEARTANGRALCHLVQLYRYYVSQSGEFCRHNPLCCFSTSVYCCKRIFSLSTQSGNFWIYPRILLKLLHYHVQKSPPLDPVLRQMNPVHNLKIHFNNVSEVVSSDQVFRLTFCMFAIKTQKPRHTFQYLRVYVVVSFELYGIFQ